MAYRTLVRLRSGCGDLPIPELVENRRRSIAMLAGAPALNRDEALELLRHLAEALRELRRPNSD